MDVLVIDDDSNIRTTLGLCLESLGCRVAQAADPRAALAALERKNRDLAFLDLRLGEASGLELLPALLQHRPAPRVVVISAYVDVPTAVEAMRRGAWEIVEKPFTPDEIRHLVERAGTERRAPYVGGDFTLDEIERQHVRAVVKRHQRLDHAARVLGIDTSTLWRKRKKIPHGS